MGEPGAERVRSLEPASTTADEQGPVKVTSPTAPDGGLTTRRRWWLIVRGLLRAAATSAVMIVLYYVLPLGSRSFTHIILELAIGIALLSATIAWQVRAIVRSTYPGIRATQALAVTTPLFLLLFAATYYILGLDDPSSFSERLARSDALYFTVTVFSTVGFGDITPQAEGTRLVVAAQMLLDLVVLGLGIQVILGAVQRSRERHGAGETDT